MKLFKKKEKGFESKRVGVISDIDYKQKSVKIVYWLIFIFAVLVAFVCIAPPLWVILSSFKDTKEFYQIPPTLFPKTWDFSKLTNAWKTLDFLKYYKNTFIITIGSILSAIIFNGLSGYVLSKLKPKGWTVVFAVIMGSMMIPAQVSMVPTYINIVNLHMLNTYWPMILMAGYNAFLTIVFKSFFDGIPSALIEAAQIDGCTRLGVFFRIVLPLSKAVMFTAAILSFNAAWGDFFWPLLVLKDRSVYTIMVEVYTVQQNIAQDQALIILTFAIIPPAIMFVFFQKYIMQGMTMSGIKG